MSPGKPSGRRTSHLRLRFAPVCGLDNREAQKQLYSDSTVGHQLCTVILETDVVAGPG